MAHLLVPQLEADVGTFTAQLFDRDLAEMIVAMLQRDPRDRLTPAQALAHPFLAAANPSVRCGHAP